MRAFLDFGWLLVNLGRDLVTGSRKPDLRAPWDRR